MATTIEKDERTAVDGQSVQMSTEDIGIASILCLNDDCLQEICEYLNLSDLCSFADVCNRFQQIAQAHFGSQKSLAITVGKWNNFSYRARFSLLRNFGKSISSLVAEAWMGNDIFLLNMITRFCDETPIELKLYNFQINIESEQKLLPLLLRLRKFGIGDCRCTRSFFDSLPSCLPMIRELELKTDVLETSRFIQPFPNLDHLSMGSSMDGEQFKAFLLLNQQLKTIQLDCMCESNNFLKLIVKYLPLVENLRFFVRSRWASFNVNFHKLRALKSLVIEGKTKMVSEAVRKIAIANVSVECFEAIIHRCDSDPFDCDELIKSMSKLKKIKALRLTNVSFIFKSDFLEACTKFTDLSELHLGCLDGWEQNDFLAVIRNTRRLQQLYCRIDQEDQSNQSWCIDVDTYVKILEIVKAKNANTQLRIVLVGTVNTIPEKIPNELRKTNESSLTIEFEKVAEQEDEFSYGDSEEDTTDSDDDYDYFYGGESDYY